MIFPYIKNAEEYPPETSSEGKKQWRKTLRDLSIDGLYWVKFK